MAAKLLNFLQGFEANEMTLAPLLRRLMSKLPYNLEQLDSVRLVIKRAEVSLNRVVGPGIIGLFLLGEIVIYAVGVPWLMRALDFRLEHALVLGLYPFVIGDVLKLLLAASLLPAAWKLTGADRSTP